MTTILTFERPFGIIDQDESIVIRRETAEEAYVYIRRNAETAEERGWRVVRLTPEPVEEPVPPCPYRHLHLAGKVNAYSHPQDGESNLIAEIDLNRWLATPAPPLKDLMFWMNDVVAHAWAQAYKAGRAAP